MSILNIMLINQRVSLEVSCFQEVVHLLGAANVLDLVEFHYEILGSQEDRLLVLKKTKLEWFNF